MILNDLNTILEPTLSCFTVPAMLALVLDNLECGSKTHFKSFEMF